MGLSSMRRRQIPATIFPKVTQRLEGDRNELDRKRDGARVRGAGGAVGRITPAIPAQPLACPTGAFQDEGVSR